jgi:L-ascorbate metabolism protein UlaG (beta-lactamase superfamily)
MAASTTLLATLIGGPTLRFEYGGVAFLTDPTFDPPGEYGSSGVPLRKVAGPALAADAVLPVDVVLLSHDQHPDNLDHAGRVFLAEAGLVLSTPAAAGRIAGVTGLEPWSSTEVAGRAGTAITVTAVPAQHGPVGSEPISGPVTGFVLRSPGLPTVYVSGDNASTDVLRMITARVGDIAVAILFVGAANVGRFGEDTLTLRAADAPAIGELLKGVVVVPVHAEDWAHFTESREEFEAAMAAHAPEVTVLHPERGRPFEIPPGRPFVGEAAGTSGSR